MCSNLNLFKHFINDLTLINNAFCSNSFNIKIGRATLCDSPEVSFFVPPYPRTLEYYTPMQLVVPSVVRIAVMMLARICKSVFTPSFFIVV